MYEHLVLVTLLVVIILQLLTISFVLGNRKQGREPHHKHRRPGVPGGENKAERKDAEARGGGANRRPGENRGGKPQQQGGRPQQSQQPAALRSVSR
jgi:hypothetical protein